jgi:hypothetical protein
MFEFELTHGDSPEARDPRHQRRIISTHRPISFVENMHDVVLACGHSPLVFGTPDPIPGEMIFCPDCYRCYSAEPLG